MEFKSWMQNGISHPPSFVKIDEGRKSRAKNGLTSKTFGGSIKNVIGD
jgi:hypothetical protein